MAIKNKTKWLCLVLLGFVLLFGACKKKAEEQIKEELPTTIDTVEDGGFVYPSHFPKPVYDFASNPVDKKKFRLGRMLFYDPILSRDSCISCANCHQQFAAFSHGGHPVSHGIDNELGTRNTPGLFNLAWNMSFMWDGAAVNIETQPLLPLANHVEMDETLGNVLRKLNAHPLYKARFKEAFGKDQIESQDMLKSLAQFMLQMVSGSSRYDKYVQGKETFSQDEVDGLALFKANCQSCHATELFSDQSFRNIGLDTMYNFGVDQDMGRMDVTGLSSDKRKFKVPSLRNFVLTRPYLHDGRAVSFYNVLDKHDSQIQDNPNLDPYFKKNGQIGIKLSVDERSKIYYFLQTLTDSEFVTDTSFSLHAYDFYPYPIDNICGYVKGHTD